MVGVAKYGRSSDDDTDEGEIVDGNSMARVKGFTVVAASMKGSG